MATTQATVQKLKKLLADLVGAVTVPVRLEKRVANALASPKKTNVRNKGAGGEREAAALLRSYGFEARRGQQFSGTKESPDVISSLPDFHLEIKRTEKMEVYVWLEKALSETDEDVMILHRKDRGKWIAILEADTMLAILQQLEERNNEA